MPFRTFRVCRGPNCSLPGAATAARARGKLTEKPPKAIPRRFHSALHGAYPSIAPRSRLDLRLFHGSCTALARLYTSGPQATLKPGERLLCPLGLGRRRVIATATALSPRPLLSPCLGLGRPSRLHNGGSHDSSSHVCRDPAAGSPPSPALPRARAPSPCRNTTSTPAILTRTPPIPGPTANNTPKPHPKPGAGKKSPGSPKF